MRSFRTVFCMFVLLGFASLCMTAEPVGPRLQKVSVNVCYSVGGYGSSTVQGSGTICLTKVEGKDSAWILTAHHVVEKLRKVNSVIDSDGDEKKQVTYGDAQIVQEQVEGGRGVGEIKYDAKVISVDPRRDIALLRVRKGDFSKSGVSFYLDKNIPQPGTTVYHCGAPGGKEIGGTCSLTGGIISRIGVRIPEFGGSQHGIFDQTDCAALGGSSGGMVALQQDGKWIGMITLGLQGGDNFHWMVPIRSLLEWAKESKTEWLFNPSLPRPTEEDVVKIPLEVNPVGFSKSAGSHDGEPKNITQLPLKDNEEKVDRMIKE